MDKVVKEEADNQNGENTQPSNLQPVAKPSDELATSSGCTAPLTQSQLGPTPAACHSLKKQEEETHATHSFMWSFSDRKPMMLTCNKAGTVEEALNRSPQFRRTAAKNRERELLIVKDGKAISSHFPCSLIRDKLLTVKYIKPDDKLKQSVSRSVHYREKGPSDKLVMFHVLVKGGKNVVKIMRNPALETEVLEITVYAYEGEKVKQALKRDGRLQDKVFKKNCAFSQTDAYINIEMSTLVNDLDGRTFKIILLDDSSPPNSQSGSLDDADMMQIESRKSESDGNQDPPQQSAATESVNDKTPEQKLKLNGDIVICMIPNSKEMQHRLSSQFKDLVQRKKTQLGSKNISLQNLFRVDFGKSSQTCREVKTMKKLMDLSDSVCQVRINGKAAGSGFLLFDKFVLTNGHVIENVYNESTRQLNERVTVHFSFESLDQVEGAEVEEVAGFEFCNDESGYEFDWALLRFSADQELPDGLLTHFGFLPQSGAICIIGHPGDGVKKIDPCLIIPTGERNQVVDRHLLENQGYIQLITDKFFDNVAENVKHSKRVLTYESCFYFGSSGSPVFDEHCNVVAVHSGGYYYHSREGKSQSVIEYGHPLSFIIEHIIVQIVERGRFDVLKKYLSCDYKQHQNLMTSLKKLVESRHLAAFKDAVNSSEVRSDEGLKMVFEFFSQKEEPVPMNID